MGGGGLTDCCASRRSVFGNMGGAVGRTESAGRAESPADAGGECGSDSSGKFHQWICFGGAAGTACRGEHIHDESDQGAAEYAGVLQRSVFPAVFRKPVWTGEAANGKGNEPGVGRDRQFGWLHTDEQSRSGAWREHQGGVE